MRRPHCTLGFGLSLVMICAVAAFGVERISAQQPADSLEQDWRALRALYTATDGDNWSNNTNWDVTNSSVVTAENLATWHGIEVAMGRVTRVRLPGNLLTGVLPPELAGLSMLQQLELPDNYLTGIIPLKLGTLAELRILNLGDNLSVPGDNALIGEIPPELGNLANLEILRLRNNALTGEIPSELANLSQLEDLWLGGNELEGEIPAGLGSLANLQFLNLSANALTGEIPSELANLSQLENLNLSNNQLEGEIPAWLGSLANLRFLSMAANALTGEIPSELANLSQLEDLRLRGNELEGEIPSELANLRELETLNLSNNQLEGEIPAWLGSLANLRFLSMAANALTGEIPSELANLSQLEDLRLGNNELEGEIPAWLGGLTNLQLLGLPGNSLTGDVPEPLGNMTGLRYLSLSNNALTGALPMSLTNLQELDYLYFSGQPLCAPLAPDFQAWLQAIENHVGDNCELLSFAESIPDQEFTKGVDIGALLLPAADGGITPVVYDLTPELPSGLVFDATAHTLSGTPTEVFPRELYRYSAIDASGAMAELTFYILVDEVLFSQRAGRALPAEFLLRGSYPNPFATMAYVEFDLPQRARITLEVHNLLGQRVLALPPKEMEAGWGRRLEMDALALPSGAYVYRMTAEMSTRASVRSARLVVLR